MRNTYESCDKWTLTETLLKAYYFYYQIIIVIVILTYLAVNVIQVNLKCNNIVLKAPLQLTGITSSLVFFFCLFVFCEHC